MDLNFKPVFVDNNTNKLFGKPLAQIKDEVFAGENRSKFRSGLRFFSPVTYFWADFYNNDTSKWKKILSYADVLGFVIVNVSSGSGSAQDQDFLKQTNLAKARGATVLGYVRTTFGDRPVDEVLQEIRNHIAWYGVHGVFLDEAVNGWSTEQQAKIPYYMDLERRIREEHGESFIIVTNPGTNTVEGMTQGDADVMMTYEQAADRYIDPSTTVTPDFYRTQPTAKFWHVIHDVTKENALEVMKRADKEHVTHLYMTDLTFVPSDDPQTPTKNPYEAPPSDWLLDAQSAWVKGRPYDEIAEIINPGSTATGSSQGSFGMTVNVCDPKYGADPTGVVDSTAAIQKAVDDVAAAGGGCVEIPGGKFRVAPPFIQLKAYVTIKGSGVGSTQIIMDASKVNESTEETGVFHTGTYNQVLSDPGLFRVCLRDFSIFASMPDGSVVRGARNQYQHLGKEFMQSKVWGIVFHTYLQAGPADPDSVHTIKDIEIWDMAGGIALLGEDDQGCKISDIRVRRTMKQGLLVGKPADHPLAYEANSTDSSKPYRRTGAADNKFHRMDISGANQSAGYYAGIEVYTAQCMFSQCTSWYHQRHNAGAFDWVTAPTGSTDNIWNTNATTSVPVPGQSNPDADRFRFAKAGAGWYIFGTRNEFANCTSQETGGHGWVLVGALCTYSDCRGESPSYKGSVYTNALVGEAAGFFVTNWAWSNILRGCIVQNAYVRSEAAGVGFYVQDYAKQLRMSDSVTERMPYINGVDDTEGERDAILPAHPGVQTRITVNGRRVSTFAYDSQTSGGSSGGSTLATAEQVSPGEIGSLIAHWDFSDKTAVTSSGGRVSQVTSLAGTATNGTLAQADSAKQPYVSALNGRQAIKTKNAEIDFLQAPDIGTVTASTGWSVVMVAAVNARINTQYLFSSIGAGAVNPASMVVTDQFGLQANSGGGTNGYTAKTDANALHQYNPDVIVMNVTSTEVTVWINGVKSVVTASPANPPASLSGKATIGAYYAGTSGGASATFGEAVLFGKTLSDTEIAGITSHLTGKWA